VLVDTEDAATTDTRRTHIFAQAQPLDGFAVVATFDRLFSRSLNTRLLSGGEEPIYLPADDSVDYHRVVFSHDYVASALHEVAHWCVAGEARRKLEDYGYWYAPDGRSSEQQIEFETVEVKPQALEWILSVAAGLPFRVSADNLEADLGASETFKDAVYAQVLCYLERGVNERVATLVDALAQLGASVDPLNAGRYLRASL